MLRIDKEEPSQCGRELRCPFSAGCRDAPGAVAGRDRQQESAGARASPSWIGGRHRPILNDFSHAALPART